MVTAMDRSIGTLLKALKDLAIEKDTMVVFLSDNGPEQMAGHAGMYVLRIFNHSSFHRHSIILSMYTLLAISLYLSWGVIITPNTPIRG
jgi:arylsulfatase A-like enzyme